MRLHGINRCLENDAKFHSDILLHPLALETVKQIICHVGVEILSDKYNSLHVLPLSLFLEQQVHQRTSYIVSICRKDNVCIESMVGSILNTVII